MSLKVTYQIKCDTCGKEWVEATFPDGRWELPDEEVFDKFYGMGWKRLIDGQDICKDCRGRRKHAKVVPQTASEFDEPEKVPGKHRFMAGTCVDCGDPLTPVCVPYEGQATTVQPQHFVETGTGSTMEWVRGRIEQQPTIAQLTGQSAEVNLLERMEQIVQEVRSGRITGAVLEVQP